MAVPVATGFVLFAWALHLRYLARAAKPAKAAPARRRRKPPTRGSGPSHGGRGALARRGHARGPAHRAAEARLGVPLVGEPGRPVTPASTASSSSTAPDLSNGSLPLPHLGDCTHDGHPSSHGQAAMLSRVARRWRSAAS